MAHGDFLLCIVAIDDLITRPAVHLCEPLNIHTRTRPRTQVHPLSAAGRDGTCAKAKGQAVALLVAPKVPLLSLERVKILWTINSAILNRRVILTNQLPRAEVALNFCSDLWRCLQSRRRLSSRNRRILKCDKEAYLSTRVLDCEHQIRYRTKPSYGYILAMTTHRGFFCFQQRTAANSGIQKRTGPCPSLQSWP